MSEKKIVEIEVLKLEARGERLKLRIWKMIYDWLTMVKGFFEGITERSKDRWFKVGYLVVWMLFIYLLLKLIFR